MIVGGETGGRWLGGFDRSLAAVLLSPFVGQKLGMLASKENAADLRALPGLIESGSHTGDRPHLFLGETADAIGTSTTGTPAARSSSPHDAAQ